MTIYEDLKKQLSKKGVNIINTDYYELIDVWKSWYKGVVDDTLRIEIRNPHRGKEKIIWVGDVFNPCSYLSMKVYGKKETRKMIYNMGFGNSTGSGFGTIRLYNE